ncbi:uncharacterized protein L969DRAFT_97350 [Mixia osmundae IAM 14324]|uniref:Uncharacterized protein n=1 Tax=Mixia osmundae (strain CBS 9802 / IAM 14324 / JCM 22182 / KY 12970) TaxID=764103 RepID=G7DV34_MIXOS|nr:uncharacterized protein L969DRAFT_97350 [Mixia osmundae IAM 14324]KEI36339.1 hypothetical protein L969DRAFT_97350 [Mixia osmundae IAM 14324]GAA94444.1 hypothetical protein E5Q_01096 [Mixia osmundae IAM 14324]
MTSRCQRGVASKPRRPPDLECISPPSDKPCRLENSSREPETSEESFIAILFSLADLTRSPAQHFEPKNQESLARELALPFWCTVSGDFPHSLMKDRRESVCV